MDHEVVLIGANFKTDISDLDFEVLLLQNQPKLWPTLESIPSYSAIEPEIIAWLETNAPTTYRAAVETSNRKAHDKILINAIKAKVLFEQLDYIGLRTLQRNRFIKLYSPVYRNLYKYLRKCLKKHDVKPEFVHINSLNKTYLNIDPYSVFSLYDGYSWYCYRELKEVLEKDPESKYLNLVKDLTLESITLNKLRFSVEEINFSPKDQSDHKTCACCFRWIRLQPSDRSRIAYHGYTRSQWGSTDVVNESCDGAKFPPFQVSADGTLHQMQIVRGQMTNAQSNLNQLDRNSRDDDIQLAILSYESTIRQGEYYFMEALARIEKIHPNRLEEAKKI